MTIEQRVAGILREVKPTRNLENIDNIIEGGYLDSFELMMLITRLGEEFGVNIGVDVITPDNFNAIGAIARMIAALQGGIQEGI